MTDDEQALLAQGERHARTLRRIQAALARHGMLCSLDDVAGQVEQVLKVLSYFVGVNQNARPRSRVRREVGAAS